MDIPVELRTAQAGGFLDGGQDEQGRQRSVVADAFLESGADARGRKGGVEAAAEEGARSGRSGRVAFHGLVFKKKRGNPCRAVRGKRRAAGMVSSGMEEPDRDAGVGGELAEDATMPGGRKLSSGSPEVS
jgi:hypothetical protein